MPSEATHNGLDGHTNGDTQYPKPLMPSGALDNKFEYEDVTPVVGRIYPTINIVDDLLNAENADELIRDVAIAISQRCAVMFRAQDNMTEESHKEFVNRLGELSGKPESSSFFINPVQPIVANETDAPDPTVTRISSVGRKSMAQPNKRRYDAALWHADGQFEPVPPSFSCLRLSKIPENGGDTLFASGYELYDRFSKTYQKFLEGLTCTFIGDGYLNAAEKNPTLIKLYEKERGSPKNTGKDLKAVHPVVRTHPVSGWKHIFPVGPAQEDNGAPKYINELNSEESHDILRKFYHIVTSNHDLSARFKWKNNNDMVIWDNRCTFHSATFDYNGLGEREGARIAGLGEVPYFDPNSKSRTEALANA